MSLDAAGDKVGVTVGVTVGATVGVTVGITVGITVGAQDEPGNGLPGPKGFAAGTPESLQNFVHPDRISAAIVR